MAKKSSMNIFESHIEKLALIISIAVLGWVLFARVLKPTTVELQGRQLKAPEAARQAAQEAQRIKEEMEDTTTPPTIPLEDRIAVTWAEVPHLPASPVDTWPLAPMLLPDGPTVQEDREYAMPLIPPLQQVAIAQYQEIVTIDIEPEDNPDADPFGFDTPTQGRQQTQREVDVDFVTVEATFPMRQLLHAFAASFTGATVEIPLEQPRPVVALVQLQRSELSADGTWSDYVDLARLEEGDPQPYVGPFTEKEITDLTQTIFDVRLADRAQRFELQEQLLRPWPYNFVKQRSWLPPSEKRATKLQEDQEQREKARADAADARNTRNTRNTRGNRGNRGQAGAGPGGAGGNRGAAPGGMGMDLGMGMGPGMGPAAGMGPGIGGQARDRAPATRRPSAVRADDKDWFRQDEIMFWAHDGRVEPGKVYRYRIRLGVYNPIAGKGWVSENQIDMDNQRVLWTPWANPEKAVRVAKRLWFFPKLRSSTTGDSTVSMEVYRKQGDMLYMQAFPIEPGSPIGAVMKVSQSGVKARRGDRDEEELIEVDFRTFATAIDIVPDSRHWYDRSNRIRTKQTTDIYYQTAAGEFITIAADSDCWDEDLRKEYVKVKKEKKTQDREQKDTTARR